MKYRAVGRTELLVSETALALDVSRAPADATNAERAFRQAYDEGVNTFLLSAPPLSDSAAAAVLADVAREKLFLGFRFAWSALAPLWPDLIERRLASLGIAHADFLIVDGLIREDLRSGAVGDAIHRLRASGRVRHVGPDLRQLSLAEDVRLIERNGFEFAVDHAGTPPSGERLFPLLAESSVVDRELSFLWENTGRTVLQTQLQLALARPGVCSVFLPSCDPAVIREGARSSIAPPLTPNDSAAIRAVLAGPVLAGV